VQSDSPSQEVLEVQINILFMKPMRGLKMPNTPSMLSVGRVQRSCRCKWSKNHSLLGHYSSCDTMTESYSNVKVTLCLILSTEVGAGKSSCLRQLMVLGVVDEGVID